MSRQNMGASTSRNPYGPSPAVTGIALPFFLPLPVNYNLFELSGWEVVSSYLLRNKK
jgi:hypothetical protein